MKKTYVAPDVEMLDFNETACHHVHKEIYSSNGNLLRVECNLGPYCPDRRSNYVQNVR